MLLARFFPFSSLFPFAFLDFDSLLSVFQQTLVISIVIFISASMAGGYIMSAIQQNVPDDMLGRIMSFYSAIVSVALPIGILLYGYLYEKFINHLPVIRSCIHKRLSPW